LRLHEVAHQRRGLVGVGVQREMAGVENVNLGVRHVLPIMVRLADIERRVMLAPDHQQMRPLLAHPGLPLRVGVDVRSIVVEEVGLNIRLPRSAQEREFVGPKIRVVALRIWIPAKMAGARRRQREKIGAKPAFVGGAIRPKGAARLPNLAQAFVMRDRILDDQRVDSFRMRERHKLRVEYYESDRSASQVLANGIVFGNQTFLAGQQVQTSINWRSFGLTYTYSLIHTDSIELGTGFGMFAVQAEAMGAIPATGQAQNESAAEPLPTLPVDFTWCISKRPGGT